MLSKLKQLRSDPGYLRLIVANFISTLGSSMDNIAFSWLVYELTGDPVWIAVIAGASMVPMVLFQSLVAVWVERQNKKKIMMAADFLGAVVMLALILLYIGEMLNPPLLLAITLINATIETVRMPAGVAVVPQILSEQNYTAGQGLNASLSQIATLIGLALAGAMIAFGGLPLIFALDGLTFIASLLIIATIKIKHNKPEKAEDSEKSPRQKGRFWSEYKAGLLMLKSSPILLTVCALAVGMNLLTSAINTYAAMFVGDYLHLSVTAYSTFSIVFIVGSILGGLIASALDEKISSKTIFVVALLCQALFYMLWVLAVPISLDWIKLAIVIASTIIFGLSSGVLGVNVSVMFMKAVPKDYIARIAGIFNSLAASSAPLSSLLLAIISAHLEIDVIFIIFAVLSLLFALAIALNKSINIDKTLEQD